MFKLLWWCTWEVRWPSRVKKRESALPSAPASSQSPPAYFAPVGISIVNLGFSLLNAPDQIILFSREYSNILKVEEYRNIHCACNIPPLDKEGVGLVIRMRTLGMIADH